MDASRGPVAVRRLLRAATLVPLLVVVGCSGGTSATSTTAHPSVSPNVMFGIASAESACMHLSQAIGEQSTGTTTTAQAALDTAAQSAQDAAQQDPRWAGFAADLLATDQGHATQAGTTRVSQVCFQLANDASFYTTASPYTSG